MFKISERVLCAFCRLERRVYIKKSIDWTNVLTAALAAVLAMFVVWQQIEPKAVIFFVVFLAMAEVFIRLRWRMSLPCPYCAFDPLLYKIDKEETVKRVKAKLDQVRASGHHLFKTQNPLENLPVVHKNSKEGLGDRRALTPQSGKPEDRILSRQV